MRALRAYVGKTVVVSAVGFDVKGRLYEVRGDCLVLRDAVALNGDKPTPIDGTLLIPTIQVSYVQVP